MRKRKRSLTFALLALVLSLAACDSNEATTTTPDTNTPSTVIPTTAADSPATTVSPSTTDARADAAEGWGRLGVDTAVFGAIRPVAGAAENDRVVLVGCSEADSDLIPIWWADGGFDFERATGPEGDRPQDLRCVDEVVSTPFGWFAGGSGPLLRSTDGISWEVADVPAILGYEETFQLGYSDNLFVSPAGDRLTVLYRRAAMNETTIATLVTTTDGENWVENAHPSQSLFDSSGIATVIEGGDGLLAAGSSPGGEFVPTAAVFTSPDGLRWRRVTPTGGPDFDDKVIFDVARFGETYIAVGGDFFETGLMTAWTSPDGLAWRRLPPPPESTDPSVAHMTGQAVTIVDGDVWVSGRDYDARRSGPQAIPAIWRSTDGEAWERIPVEDLEINVPFEIVSTQDIRIGVWPAPGSLVDEPMVFFAGD